MLRVWARGRSTTRHPRLPRSPSLVHDTTPLPSAHTAKAVPAPAPGGGTAPFPPFPFPTHTHPVKELTPREVADPPCYCANPNTYPPTPPSTAADAPCEGADHPAHSAVGRLLSLHGSGHRDDAAKLLALLGLPRLKGARQGQERRRGGDGKARGTGGGGQRRGVGQAKTEGVARAPHVLSIHVDASPSWACPPPPPATRR